MHAAHMGMPFSELRSHISAGVAGRLANECPPLVQTYVVEPVGIRGLIL
jgi:hypothetical protein